MSDEPSPGSRFDPALVALDKYLLQREALRRAAEGRASGSPPSALESMLARISAQATSEAAERPAEQAAEGRPTRARGAAQRPRSSAGADGDRGRKWGVPGAISKGAVPHVVLQGRPVMMPGPMQEKADREKESCLAPGSGPRRARTRHYTVALSDVVHRFVASEDGRPPAAAVHGEASYPPHSPHCSARLLLERHGARAVVHAAKELADCQACGDGDGYAEWGEIADAIEYLQGHRVVGADRRAITEPNESQG